MTRMSWIGAAAFVLAASSLPEMSLAGNLVGQVQLGGAPASGVKVTLWRTDGKRVPAQLMEASTGTSGIFKMTDFPEPTGNGIYYLTTRSGPGNAVALLSILGEKTPPTVVVNELTTVASV